MLTRLTFRWWLNRSGGTSILFALAVPAMIGMVGGAVDYASASKSRARLQASTDAAALAIAREMTITPMAQNRATELANAHVNANLNGSPAATVTAQMLENGLAVEISAKQPLTTPLGILPAISSVNELESKSFARVTASSMQTKLCMLSLGTRQNGGIFLHNGSFISAPECVLHSNSNDRNAVIVQTGSKVAASLLCARGGVANLAGTLQTTLLSDCPMLPDPLLNKPEPASDGPCTATKLVIGTSNKANPKHARDPERVSRTLTPGIYCGGVVIETNGRVQLNPGVYVIKDGPLVVRGDGELAGRGVTFLFAGRKAHFRFLDNALIQLSAPTTGTSAGMLLWESRRFEPGLDSWITGACGKPTNALGTADDDADDAGNGVPGCLRQRRPGDVPVKKTNEHHINSDRARELTGTIYLPNGLLLVDSRRPVADQSPFTVLLANKVDLFDGPNLVLNSNYSGSPVPVPKGLGAIGATQVRLGLPGRAPPDVIPPPPAGK